MYRKQTIRSNYAKHSVQQLLGAVSARRSSRDNLSSLNSSVQFNNQKRKSANAVQKQQEIVKKNSKALPAPQEHPVIKLTENISQGDVSNSFERLNVHGIIGSFQNADQIAKTQLNESNLVTKQMLAHSLKALVNYFDEKISSALMSVDKQHYPEGLSAIDVQNQSKGEATLNQSNQDGPIDHNQSDSRAILQRIDSILNQESCQQYTRNSCKDIEQLTSKGDEVIIQSLTSNKQSKRSNAGSSKQVDKENYQPGKITKNLGSSTKKVKQRSLGGSTVSAKDLLMGSSSRVRKSSRKNRNDSKNSIKEFGQTLLGFNTNATQKLDSLNCSKRSKKQDRKQSNSSRSASSTQNLFKPNPNFISKSKNSSKKQSCSRYTEDLNLNDSCHPIQQLLVPEPNQFQGNLSSRQNFKNNTNSTLKQCGIVTPNYGGQQDVSDNSQKNDMQKVETAQSQSIIRPSKFQLLEQDYFKQNQEFLSNEAISQQSPKRHQVDDITPDKPSTLNIVHLLSNLEGLTAAGLEHLMETQDRVAGTTKTTPIQQHGTLLSNQDEREVRTQFCSDNADGLEVEQDIVSIGCAESDAINNRLKKSHSLCSRPYPSAPNDFQGSVTARQKLSFVDVSDGKTPSMACATSSKVTTPVVSTTAFINNHREVQRKLQYDTESDSHFNLLERPIATTLSSTQNVKGTKQVIQPPSPINQPDICQSA